MSGADGGWYDCPRCGNDLEEPPYVLSVWLTPRIPYTSICGACYRDVFGVEPPEQPGRQLLLRKHGSRRRGGGFDYDVPMPPP
jgi:hypothetical protein